MIALTGSPESLPRPEHGRRDGDAAAFLAGGGEMGRLTRGFDWASTSLGVPETWPQALRTIARLLLTTRHPMYVFWGAEHLGLYNDAYRASLGPEKHPAILGTPGEASWQEIWTIIGPQIELVMRGDGATWHENQLVPIIRHGELRDVYWTYSFGPIDDETAPNGIGGVLVVCTETTAQVLAERHRADEVGRLRSLFVQAPGFMCVLRGPDHVFEITNAAYTALVGDRELVGKPLREAIPDVEGQGFLELLDRVYASGDAYVADSQSIFLQRVHGEPLDERFLDFIYQPVRDAAGAVTGIFVEGADVTARVLSRRSLEASESRLRAALAIAELGTFTWEAWTGAISLDDRSRVILGFAGDEEASATEVLGRIHAQDRDRVRADILNAADGASRLDAEFRVDLPGEGARFILVVGEGVPDADGGDPTLVGVFADVTERRRSETERQTLIDALAHDLLTPLSSLKAQAQLLHRQLRRNVEFSAEDLAERIGRFDQLADRMADLVRQLGEHAHLAMGRPVILTRSETDLVGLIRDAIGDLRLAGVPHDIRLESEAEAILGQWDPRLLRRVATNLLDNAVKYSPDGGDIHVSATEEDGTAIVRVRDVGIGIPDTDLEGVFDIRRRGGNVQGIGGSGIGLAGVWRIVEQHGGTITVESTVGEGTTFEVRLPMGP